MTQQWCYACFRRHYGRTNMVKVFSSHRRAVAWCRAQNRIALAAGELFPVRYWFEMRKVVEDHA